MPATYHLTAFGDEKTEVRMTTYNTTSPSFMIHLIAVTLGKVLRKHLFGLKYYIETGKAVNPKNDAAVFINYK